MIKSGPVVYRVHTPLDEALCCGAAFVAKPARAAPVIPLGPRPLLAVIYRQADGLHVLQSAKDCMLMILWEKCGLSGDRDGSRRGNEP